MIYLCLPEARSGAVFVWFFFSFCCIAVSFIGGSTDRHLVKKNALPPTTANVLSNFRDKKMFWKIRRIPAMQMESLIGHFRFNRLIYVFCAGGRIGYLPSSFFFLLSFFIGSGIDGRIDAILANRTLLINCVLKGQQQGSFIKQMKPEGHTHVACPFRSNSRTALCFS